MSLFNPVPIFSNKEALAPIAKQLAAFGAHKQTLSGHLANDAQNPPTL